MEQVHMLLCRLKEKIEDELYIYVLFCSKCGCECQEDTINEECSKDGYHYFIQTK